ncbi:MAG: ABC transporter permease [Clostridiales bacterium]
MGSIEINNDLKLLKKVYTSKIFWPLTALILIFVFDSIFIDGFTKITIKEGNFYGIPIDILKNVTPLLLISIGMTMIIATKGIDISVGSVFAISGAISARLIGGESVPENSYFIAILVALLISLILGTWNGFLVSKLGIQPIVATLILMVSGRGIAQLITEGQIITIYYEPYYFLGGGYIPFLKLPFSILIAASVFVISILIVKCTALGIFIKSIGINPIASRFSGIKVSRIILLTYMFSGLCAGIAGLIYSSNIRCADGNNAGLFIELDAILAVAIGANSLNGGKFSILSSCIGALVIQTITTTMYSIGVSPEKLPVVKAIIVIIICLVQSEKFRDKLKAIFSNKGGMKIENI